MSKEKVFRRQIMKDRLVVVVLCGVVIGLVTSSFFKSEAQGQVKQERQVWEYRVESFSVGESAGMNNTHARVINGLASEGWEYVGLIGSGQSAESIHSFGNVLFKRPKK
jgi:hypothetical protein